MEGFFIALGAALFVILGFLAVDKISEVVLDQKIEITLPMVSIEVNLGDEVTEILRGIEGKLK